MVALEFEFHPQKTAEAIIYLAQRISQPTALALAKLLYFADKTSLELYGRSITGDTYYAMQHGPVPSNAYDMMKAAKDTDVYGFHIEYEKHIVPNRNANLGEFSKSDMKCLDQVAAAYGNYPLWQLRELSHDEAWQKAWANAGNAHRVRIPMEDVISILDDEEHTLMEYLRETHKPQRLEER
jgi:uncharacterized phage-associated protein